MRRYASTLRDFWESEDSRDVLIERYHVVSASKLSVEGILASVRTSDHNEKAWSILRLCNSSSLRFLWTSSLRRCCSECSQNYRATTVLGSMDPVAARPARVGVGFPVPISLWSNLFIQPKHLHCITHAYICNDELVVCLRPDPMHLITISPRFSDCASNILLYDKLSCPYRLIQIGIWVLLSIV